MGLIQEFNAEPSVVIQPVLLQKQYVS